MDTNFKGSKDQRINGPPKAAAKGSTSRRRRRPKDQPAAKGGGQRISKLYKTASKDQSAANGQRINDPAARPRYLSLYIVVFLDRWIVIPKDQRIKGSTGRRRRRPKDQPAASKDQSAGNGQRFNDPTTRPRYLPVTTIAWHIIT